MNETKLRPGDHMNNAINENIKRKKKKMRSHSFLNTYVDVCVSSHKINSSEMKQHNSHNTCKHNIASLLCMPRRLRSSISE